MYHNNNYYCIINISLFVKSLVILHIEVWPENWMGLTLHLSSEQKPVVLIHVVDQNEIQLKVNLTSFDLTVTQWVVKDQQKNSDLDGISIMH